jgi:uncharacterized protein YcfJ
MPTSLSKIIANKSILSGGIILGFTGGLIGYYLGEWGSILTGFFLGASLGGFVGTFGAKTFFLSIGMGTVLLGIIGYRIGGWEIMEICAGTGAAMGGFIGITIENIIQQRKKNENRFMDSRLFRK